MKKVFAFSILLMLILALNSCAIAGGIFKAGIWVGVLAVVGIIGLIIFLISRGSKKN